MALKCCKGVAFTCGTKYHYDWIQWKRPDYHEKYWYKANATAFILNEPILFYGKIKNFSEIRQTIEIPNIPQRLKHPTPKPIKLYLYLLKKIRPNTVLDMFVGR